MIQRACRYVLFRWICAAVLLSTLQPTQVFVAGVVNYFDCRDLPLTDSSNGTLTLSDSPNGTLTANPKSRIVLFPCDMTNHSFTVGTAMCQEDECFEGCGVADPRKLNRDSKLMFGPEELFFVCIPGFTFLGESNATCFKNGTWDTTLPSCMKDCPPPEPPINGSVNATSGYDGQTIWFICDDTYILVGKPTTLCKSSGQWDVPSPTCHKVCPNITAPDAGSVNATTGYSGQTVLFGCDLGWRLSGPQLAECQDNGNWSDTSQSCSRMQCPNFTDPDGGTVNSTLAYSGESVLFTCYAGYSMSGVPIVDCLMNGTWSRKPPTCHRKQCKDVQDPDGGTVNSTSAATGDSVAFECNPGYQQIGAALVECLLNATWSHLPPTCQRLQCPYVTAPRDGTVNASTALSGGYVSYQCGNGFTMDGRPVVHCLLNGSWGDLPPTCNKIVTTTPQTTKRLADSTTAIVIATTTKAASSTAATLMSGKTDTTVRSGTVASPSTQATTNSKETPSTSTLKDSPSTKRTTMTSSIGSKTHSTNIVSPPPPATTAHVTTANVRSTANVQTPSTSVKGTTPTAAIPVTTGPATPSPDTSSLHITSQSSTVTTRQGTLETSSTSVKGTTPTAAIPVTTGPATPSPDTSSLEVTSQSSTVTTRQGTLETSSTSVKATTPTTAIPVTTGPATPSPDTSSLSPQSSTVTTRPGTLETSPTVKGGTSIPATGQSRTLISATTTVLPGSTNMLQTTLKSSATTLNERTSTAVKSVTSTQSSTTTRQNATASQATSTVDTPTSVPVSTSGTTFSSTPKKTTASTVTAGTAGPSTVATHTSEILQRSTDAITTPSIQTTVNYSRTTTKGITSSTISSATSADSTVISRKPKTTTNSISTKPTSTERQTHTTLTYPSTTQAISQSIPTSTPSTKITLATTAMSDKPSTTMSPTTVKSATDESSTKGTPRNTTLESPKSNQTTQPATSMIQTSGQPSATTVTNLTSSTSNPLTARLSSTGISSTSMLSTPTELTKSSTETIRNTGTKLSSTSREMTQSSITQLTGVSSTITTKGTTVATQPASIMSQPTEGTTYNTTTAAPWTMSPTSSTSSVPEPRTTPRTVQSTGTTERSTTKSIKTASTASTTEASPTTELSGPGSQAATATTTHRPSSESATTGTQPTTRQSHSTETSPRSAAGDTSAISVTVGTTGTATKSSAVPKSSTTSTSVPATSAAPSTGTTPPHSTITTTQPSMQSFAPSVTQSSIVTKGNSIAATVTPSTSAATTTDTITPQSTSTTATEQTTQSYDVSNSQPSTVANSSSTTATGAPSTSVATTTDTIASESTTTTTTPTTHTTQTDDPSATKSSTVQKSDTAAFAPSTTASSTTGIVTPQQTAIPTTQTTQPVHPTTTQLSTVSRSSSSSAGTSPTHSTDDTSSNSTTTAIQPSVQSVLPSTQSSTMTKGIPTTEAAKSTGDPTSQSTTPTAKPTTKPFDPSTQSSTVTRSVPTTATDVPATSSTISTKGTEQLTTTTTTTTTTTAKPSPLTLTTAVSMQLATVETKSSTTVDTLKTTSIGRAHHQSTDTPTSRKISTERVTVQSTTSVKEMISTTRRSVDAGTASGRSCPGDIDFRRNGWNRTVSGQRMPVIKECQKGYEGHVSRYCTKEGQWLLPKYDCTSHEILKIAQTFEDSGGVSEVNVTDCLIQLAHETALTNTNGLGLHAGDLQAATSILNSIADSGSITNDHVKNYVSVASNLMDEMNTYSWQSLHQTLQQGNTNELYAEDVLQSMEKFVFSILDKFAESGGVQNKTFATSNIVAEVAMTTSPSGPILFPRRSNVLEKWIMNSSNGLLPLDSVTNLGVKSYASVIYRNISGILRNESYLQEINSNMISFQLNPKPQLLEPEPITINFRSLQERYGYSSRCSYWNFQRRTWAFDGCEKVSSNTTITVCRCWHLTNFALLMSPWVETDSNNEPLHVISLVGCSISVLGLLVTCASHIFAWRYAKSDRAIILLNLCTALIVSYAIFILGVDHTEHKDLCTAVAALLQYIYLVVFCLMLAEGIEIGFTILSVFSTKSRVKWLLPLAWGIPVVIVSISLAVTKFRGYGSDEYCWLSLKNALIWAFIGPALTIIIVNVVVLACVMKTMFRTTGMTGKSRAQKVKTGVRSLCVLLPVMGVTWVIGIFYVSTDTVWVQYIFAICNGLQGLSIFLFHCAMNRKLINSIRMVRDRWHRLSPHKSVMKREVMFPADALKRNTLRARSNVNLTSYEEQHVSASQSVEVSAGPSPRVSVESSPRVSAVSVEVRLYTIEDSSKRRGSNSSQCTCTSYL